MNLPPIDADGALAEERVVGRDLLHLRDDLGAVVALERLHRLQVVRDTRIDAGVDHGRMDTAIALGEPLGEGARPIIQVPVERLGEDEPLRGLEPESMDVREEHEEACEVLPTLDDAELRALLDGVRGVAARIGQPDHLRLGRLSLEEEGGEILGVERMAHLAQHLAAVLEHHGLDVPLEGMAESVVRGDEEPGIRTLLDEGIAGAVGERPRVVRPVDRVGRAGLAGQVGGRGRRDDEGLALVARDLADGEGHAGVRHVHDQVHLVHVVPLASDRGPHVGLVLMVGEDDFHFHALLVGAVVLAGTLAAMAIAAAGRMAAGETGGHVDRRGLFVRSVLVGMIHSGIHTRIGMIT